MRFPLTSLIWSILQVSPTCTSVSGLCSVCSTNPALIPVITLVSPFRPLWAALITGRPWEIAPSTDDINLDVLEGEEEDEGPPEVPDCPVDEEGAQVDVPVAEPVEGEGVSGVGHAEFDMRVPVFVERNRLTRTTFIASMFPDFSERLLGQQVGGGGGGGAGGSSSPPVGGLGSQLGPGLAAASLLPSVHVTMQKVFVAMKDLVREVLGVSFHVSGSMERLQFGRTPHARTITEGVDRGTSAAHPHSRPLASEGGGAQNNNNCTGFSLLLQAPQCPGFGSSE